MSGQYELAAGARKLVDECPLLADSAHYLLATCEDGQPDEEGAMADDGESMLELFGALTKCLSHAIARMTLRQLDAYEGEVTEMLRSREDESAAANAFRSVLREIDSRRVHLLLQ